MIVIYPDSPNQDVEEGLATVFLAGSIEMDVAEPWQDEVIHRLRHHDDVVAYNPRRKSWDSSWVQSADNPQFRAQVTWEAERLTSCDAVIVYFDPNTRSPITLQELGILEGLSLAGEDREVHVCCPDGFWRKGNVQLACERAEFEFYHTKEDLYAWIDSLAVDAI